MRPPGTPKPLLGELLISGRACTPRQLEEALDDQVVYDGRLGTNLLERGAITEEQLARALSQQHGLPARWGDIAVDPDALASVAARGAERWQAVPLRLERRCLDVLVSEARDPTRLDDMAFAVGKEVRPVLVAESRLWELLSRYYAVPCPRRRTRAARPRTPGPGLASHQDLLLELQDAVGPAYRTAPPTRAPPQPPALPAVTPEPLALVEPSEEAELEPYRLGFEGTLLTDESILAEMQGYAARRFRPGLPSAAPADRGSAQAGAPEPPPSPARH